MNERKLQRKVRHGAAWRGVAVLRRAEEVGGARIPSDPMQEPARGGRGE